MSIIANETNVINKDENNNIESTKEAKVDEPKEQTEVIAEEKVNSDANKTELVTLEQQIIEEKKDVVENKNGEVITTTTTKEETNVITTEDKKEENIQNNV